MFHGALTLLNRSIRDDALQQHPHLLRLTAVMILLTMFIVSLRQPQEVGAPGLVFFQQLAYLGVALITLAGIGHFSSSITEEKEEGTLGLLLMANISPLAVLLGKSTNRVFSAMLVLLTLFPFALLSLTLGGITSLQIVAAFLSLAAYLFFVANLALVVSVLVNRSNEAVVVMTLLMMILLGVPEVLNSSVQDLIAHHELTEDSLISTSVTQLYDLHQKVSVIHELNRILDPTHSFSGIGTQVPASILLGVGLFLLAMWRFSYVVWAPVATEPVHPRGINQSNRWLHVVTRPWKAAIAWKDFHFIAGGPMVLIFKCLFYPFWLWLCLSNAEFIRKFFSLSALQFLLASFAVMLVAELFIASSQLFQIERKSGTLSTLLMIPKSLFSISLQKILGCLLGSLPTILFLIVIAAAIPSETFFSGWRHDTRGASIYPLLTIISLACVIFVTCELTVLWSLIVNWGALPLAIGCMLILLTVFFPVLSAIIYVLSAQNQPDYSLIGPVIYVTGFVSVVLQFEILRRVENLSGR